MKKLLLGIGSFAAAAAPVAAVVACGDDDNKVVPNGMINSFTLAPNTVAGAGHVGDGESTTYNRFKLVANAGTEALKAIVAADADVLTDSHDLDEIEEHLRDFLKNSTDAKYAAQTAVEKTLDAITPEKQSQITVATFPTPGASDDDHVEIGVNGFASKADAVAFLKDALANAGLSGAPLTILTEMLKGL